MLDNLVLPDEAVTGRPPENGTLERVGMEGISLPFHIRGESGTAIPVTAAVDVFVELADPQAKGIHMSRLYKLLVHRLGNKELSTEGVVDVMKELVSSQNGLSKIADLTLRFSLLLPKKALISNEYGFQRYQVSLRFLQSEQGMTTQTTMIIPYSSTCPCSAGLSRVALRDAVIDAFGDGKIDASALSEWLISDAGTVATPHSQRSYATVMLESSDLRVMDFNKLVSQLETAIATPVQTAVKREDEQAFAMLNANNLMFCEDAARKLKSAITNLPSVQSYWLKVDHRESLHAHNAVAIDFNSAHLAHYQPVS